MSILAALLLAAQPAPATAADPRAIAAAEKLMDAADYDKLMTRLIDTLIAGQRDSVAAKLRDRMGEEADEKLIVKISDFLGQETRAMFRENGPQLRRAYALLYAKYFTTPELERLAAIQTDPAMKKSIEVMPSLMNEVMTLMDGITDQRQEETERKLMEMISDHLGESKG